MAPAAATRASAATGCRARSNFQQVSWPPLLPGREPLDVLENVLGDALVKQCTSTSGAAIGAGGSRDPMSGTGGGLPDQHRAAQQQSGSFAPAETSDAHHQATMSRVHRSCYGRGVVVGLMSV